MKASRSSCKYVHTTRESVTLSLLNNLTRPSRICIKAKLRKQNVTNYKDVNWFECFYKLLPQATFVSNGRIMTL